MTKILDMDKKYQILLLFMVIFFLAFLIIAIFISMHNMNNKTEKNMAIVESQGTLAINYVNGKIININSSKQTNYEYIISVTNTGEDKIYYSINFFGEYKLKNVDIILENEKGKILYDEKYQSGNNSLLTLMSIEPKKTDRYILTINNINNRKKIKGEINISNESLSNETFSDLILQNNELTIQKSNPGIDITNSDEGLIKNEDDFGITYYFRGKSQNNYLKIGKYNFRIVRINGDSTVRVVLDDNIDLNVPFNNSSINPQTNNFILSNATIKNDLLSWIDNNLSDYKSYLSLGRFCLNTNVYNQMPTFKCNNSVALQAGLLSADEIAFAGGIINSENKNYYLYNSKITSASWTSSSYMTNNQTFLFILSNNGSLTSNNNPNTSLKVRPVLNINMNAHIKGKGTKKNPYILVK